MNDEQILRHRLQDVGGRYRRLLLRVGLAATWLVLAAAGVAVLAFARGAGHAVPGIALLLIAGLPVVLVPILVRALRAVREPLWVARRLERRFPDLDARLLAALEQRHDGAGGLGFLQHTVVREAIEHSRGRRWEQLVPSYRLRGAQLAQCAALAGFAAVLIAVVIDMQRRPSGAGWLAGGPVRGIAESFELKVEPEDTEVERGTGLLVLARLGGKRLPGDVQLLSRAADGEVRQVAMSKSLDDPVFAGRIAQVDQDLTYAVRYGQTQTRWFEATVFDFPDLKQADARLKFPEYTGMEEKLVEDTRSVTAVEGTRATFTFRLNKPVAEARLVPVGDSAKEPIRPTTAPSMTLTADAADPSVYTVEMDVTHSQRFRLQLVDAQGRQNKASQELAINATQNRPPDLKLQWPGRDVDVSPLEELSIRAQAWDDFGLRRVGVSYGLAGREPRDAVLVEGAKANESRDVAQLVSLEKLAAKPDELLSYYVWAEDVGPDGQVRRTDGDMFFAEVRDFEQIFRQGQQPAGGEQQQQQGGQNGQQAEQLAELQKQIIAATWKLTRRDGGAKLTAEFGPDVTLVGVSQKDAREQADALGERLQDARSKGHLKNVLKHMDDATAQLTNAAASPSPEPLRPALVAEQAAYQELLKLRAREVEVVRGQPQQQGGSQSGAAQRQQQKFNELQLDQEENRYETQRAAAAPQESAEQRETRQVLNRLKELAQRQEDLNRQMRELQSALEQAKEEAKREELKRQLARLRDQQQQMLRDTDELRDRMDQPENQQRMAESRAELEQTRENVREASEALEEGMVPEASAEGTRAGERLNNLRDEFRKAAAGQFNDAMDRLRQEARELDRTQRELSKQLAQLDPAQQEKQQRSLRDAGEREQVTKGLSEQKEKLDGLLEEMRKTIDESETAEPLLSKKLYDAVREAHQQKTDRALDASRQLLDQGFVEEARRAEGDAGKGVTRLRQGVEQAAESVLGDEAEALRRARDELDALAQELEREMGRRGPAGSPATQPAEGREGRLARSDPTTRGSDARVGEGDSEQSAAAGRQDEAKAASDRGEQGGDAPGQKGAPTGRGGGENSERAGREPGDEEPAEMADAGGGDGGQPGEREQPGEPGGQGQASGPEETAQAGNPRQGSNRAGGLRQRGGNPAGGRGGSGGGEAVDPDAALGQLLQRGTGPAGREGRGGPMAGGGFRDWSDRLRDVEESVGDPRLRAEAARIRDRAREMRAAFDRHSERPNWDLVRQFVSEPLAGLRDEVARELLRRESPEALVPIDREPVPPQYADQVRRYYERLGGGR